MNTKKTQWFWFIGGFALGFSLIAVGHAVPTRTGSNLSELRTAKVETPAMEQDYAKLTSLEARYAESADQQKRLKMATGKSSRRSRN